jgi:hypothetical protein
MTQQMSAASAASAQPESIIKQFAALLMDAMLKGDIKSVIGEIANPRSGIPTMI